MCSLGFMGIKQLKNKMAGFLDYRYKDFLLVEGGISHSYMKI